MTSAKFQQLIEKYSTGAPSTPMTSVPTALLEQSEGRFKHQQKRMTEFAHGFQTKLRVLIAEMEHDISLLKERKFDRNMQVMMIKIWENLITIYRSFHQDRPYEAATKLIEYVHEKHTKDIIDNLDFLAQHHIKKTNVDFTPMSAMENPEIKSLKLLTNLAQYLQNYIKENPLLEKTKPIPISYPPNTTPTWRPPAMPAEAATPEVVEPEKEAV
jgi:hypothetical protein